MKFDKEYIFDTQQMLKQKNDKLYSKIKAIVDEISANVKLPTEKNIELVELCRMVENTYKDRYSYLLYLLVWSDNYEPEVCDYIAPMTKDIITSIFKINNCLNSEKQKLIKSITVLSNYFVNKYKRELIKRVKFIYNLYISDIGEELDALETAFGREFLEYYNIDYEREVNYEDM